LVSGSVTVATRRPPYVVGGLVDDGTRAGHLAQLRLDVPDVPVRHGGRHALRSAARHQPDVLALGLEAHMFTPFVVVISVAVMLGAAP
jgi:hypothetical protein